MSTSGLLKNVNHYKYDHFTASFSHLNFSIKITVHMDHPA